MRGAAVFVLLHGSNATSYGRLRNVQECLLQLQWLTRQCSRCCVALSIMGMGIDRIHEIHVLYFTDFVTFYDRFWLYISLFFRTLSLEEQHCVWSGLSASLCVTLSPTNTSHRRCALINKAAVSAQNSWGAKDGASPPTEADGNGFNNNVGEEGGINDILFRGREQASGEISSRKQHVQTCYCITQSLPSGEATEDSGRGCYHHRANEGGDRCIPGVC
mmetsp:Transcript_37637/g.82429  ORF Transcript_37637/g.82429 Transcript_37637/m.82429 type:complete len:218 (+) Transcript_37637:1095-1748(+)